MKKHAKLLVSGSVLVVILLITALGLKNDPKSISIQECVLAKGLCKLKLDQQIISLSIYPNDIPLETELSVSIQADTELELDSGYIEGVNMYMGKIPVIVDNSSESRKGYTFLGACSEPKMRWKMTLNVRDQQQNITSIDVFFDTDINRY